MGHSENNKKRRNAEEELKWDSENNKKKTTEEELEWNTVKIARKEELQRKN